MKCLPLTEYTKKLIHFLKAGIYGNAGKLTNVLSNISWLVGAKMFEAIALLNRSRLQAGVSEDNP